MNLRPKTHPAHKLEYMVSGPNHIVVGGSRWLIEITGLPRIWGPSRFLTETEAKQYIEEVTEDDVVTAKYVKQLHHSI